LSSAHAIIVDRIRSAGPITAAEFMELALYHPRHGYYATAAQRSGRGGDFITSVDVGPLFGEMLAVQLAEMWALLQPDGRDGVDLVEAAAGNGRLMRDVLDAAAADHPAMYARARVTLVERGREAREAHPATLAAHAPRLQASLDDLPSHIDGVLFANELLDAMPAHVVVQRGAVLREIRVAERDGVLHECEGPLSDPRIARQLERAGASLQDGWRAEVSLAARDWVRRAAAAIDRGFLLLFDYGHRAPDLYSAAHAHGTLLSYRRHVAGGRGWLDDPGLADLTTHVDLTSVEAAAAEAGMTPVGAVDQTYFLTALGLVDHLGSGGDRRSVERRMAAKALVLPGGLGSTMKVLCYAKGVGRPALRGLSSGRLT
jgi:SAM-dependent MidA family methyltransferase